MKAFFLEGVPRHRFVYVPAAQQTRERRILLAEIQCQIDAILADQRDITKQKINPGVLFGEHSFGFAGTDAGVDFISRALHDQSGKVTDAGLILYQKDGLANAR